MVKMVEEELKMEVREDMRAASITASMRPRSPVGIFSFTSMMKARLVHPDLERKACWEIIAVFQQQMQHIPFLILEGGTCVMHGRYFASSECI